MAGHGLLAQLAIVVGAAAGAAVVAAQAESVDVLRDNVQLAQEGASVLTAAAGIVSALSKGEMRAEMAWREVIPYIATWLDVHGFEGKSWLATEEEHIDMDKTEKGLDLMSSIVIGVDYQLHGLYLKKWWRYNTGEVATVVVVERASNTCSCALVTLPSPTMASLLKSRVGSSQWEIVDGCKVFIKCSSCHSGTAAWSLFAKAVKDAVDDMGKPTEQRKYPCSLCSTGSDRSSYIWNYRISQIIASAEEKTSGKLTTAQLKATQDTRDLMSFKAKFNTSTRAKYVGIIVEGVAVMALCWAIKASPLLSASIGRRMVRGNVVGMNMTSCLPAEFADTVTVLKEEATADAWLTFTMDPAPPPGESFLRSRHIPRMARIRLITAWIILSNLGGMALWVACTAGLIRPLLGQETSATPIEIWQTVVLSVFCVFAGVAGKLYRIHVAPYQAPKRLCITQTLKKPRSIALILVGLGLLVLLVLGRVWHGGWLGSLRTAIIGTEVANILCWWIVEWVSIPSARNPAAPLRGQVVSQPCTYLTESVIGFVQGHLT
ncbi:hypothetical protein GOP47_0025081 [Adiantum capillus-veneris]|uniref:Uncharacterized protein n=1 Tax=Adiantum capillus-veneris TaxID=13818 RepID=A0A9D4U5K7_ADICA|nr:hypothetical protein GOP47_0025081 [Adiantum capillus-veneris]